MNTKSRQAVAMISKMRILCNNWIVQLFQYSLLALAYSVHRSSNYPQLGNQIKEEIPLRYFPKNVSLRTPRSIPISVRNLHPIRSLAQNFINLLGMSGEVIHQVIPHLGIMLMLLLAVPSIVRDSEWSA
jgi:hypothetical protein